MRAIVDKDLCIACEACVNTCPEVFRMSDDGLSEAYGVITSAVEATAIEARDNCPVGAISIED